MTETCELCGHAELELVYRPADSGRGLSVYLCNHCGLVQSLPRIDRSQQRTTRVSAGAGWGNVRYGKAFRTGPALEMIASLGPARQFRRILDVGANRGDFLLTWQRLDTRAELWGVEPDSAVTDAYRNQSGIHLLEGRVEDVDLPVGYFDLIFCSHTLEHVAEPGRVLDLIRTALSEQGWLYLEVPNLDILGRNDLVEEFFIDKHLYHFSAATLRAALAKAGFRIEHWREDPGNLQLLAQCSEQVEPVAADAAVVHARTLLSGYATNLNGNRARLRDLVAGIAALAPRRVAIWGAGRIFDSLVTAGGLDPHNLCAVFDRELPKYVDRLHGVPILLPQRMPEFAPDVVLVASRAFLAEIKSEAQRLAHGPLEVLGLFELLDRKP